MIYRERPEDFADTPVRAVGCTIEWEGRILLLLRHASRMRGRTWGFPGGKAELGETIEDALVREVREETGLVKNTKDFIFVETFYVRYIEYDFCFHVYRLTCEAKPSIHLREGEHTDYAWVTPRESLEMNFIEDGALCTRMLYGLDQENICGTS